mmetsp:Transcript_24277/g.50774  ORF Transcript_24277/g.50774 Transcript_24277/m.50774 type:complete len:108 (-) Transcript_24277:34-357(-)
MKPARVLHCENHIQQNGSSKTPKTTEKMKRRTIVEIGSGFRVMMQSRGTAKSSNTLRTAHPRAYPLKLPFSKARQKLSHKSTQNPINSDQIQIKKGCAQTFLQTEAN